MSKTVSDYLAEICGSPSAAAVYAYRGQRNSSWPLRSGAARRLLEHYRSDDESRVPSFSRVYAEYHEKVLIEPARTRGFGLDSGRELSDLEILAALQHFGAATGLLDFTYSPLIALWFACEKEECDGKVFSINTTDPLAFGRLGYKRIMEEDVSKLLSPDGDDSRPWIWEPVATGDAETRVLIQHSLFVIGRPSIAEDVAREVVIEKGDKEELRKELDDNYAIREEALYKDVYGFASVNRASYPIPAFEGPELYWLFGNRKYQEGDYQGAIDNYDRSIGLQSDESASYLNRGNAKRALGRHREAIADYNQALRLRPGYALAFYNRGVAKDDLGCYKEAVADYDQALRLQPDYAEAYVNRGYAKSNLGRHKDAIADYDQALRLRPDYAEAYVNRSYAKSKLGCHKDAIADCDRALHLQPNFARAYNNRGAAKDDLGHHVDAIADYDQALRLQPDYVAAFYNRGRANGALDRHECSIADYGEALRLQPDHALAYANRGESKAALGRVSQARRDYERALALAQEVGDDSLVSETRELMQALDNTEQA